MSFLAGNKDGKHYWLTPPKLYKRFNDIYHFDFDPCPYPKPVDFDGLTVDWGNSNWVNPPFGSIIGADGKKKGPTAWARKAIEENKKGKNVVLVYPTDKWIHYLLNAGAELISLGDVRWHSIEDNTPGKGIGRFTMAFVLKSKDPTK